MGSPVPPSPEIKFKKDGVEGKWSHVGIDDALMEEGLGTDIKSEINLVSAAGSWEEIIDPEETKLKIQTRAELEQWQQPTEVWKLFRIPASREYWAGWPTTFPSEHSNTVS